MQSAQKKDGPLAALTTSLLAPALAASLCTTAAAAPQGMTAGGPQDILQLLGTVAEDAIPFMSFALGDAAEWVNHPKDAGLKRAFALLDDRLADLPLEMGGEIPPPMQMVLSPEVIPTWMHFLRAPKSFTLGGSAELQNTGGEGMVFGFALHEANEEAAIAYEAELRGLVESMGAEMPPGILQRQGSSLVVKAGLQPAAIGATKAAGMLTGGTMVEEVTINVGGFVKFIENQMQQGFAPPEAAMVFDILSGFGLDEMTMDVAVKTDGTRMNSASVMTGIAGRMVEAGILKADGIMASHLAPIPADAHLAIVERLDMGAVFEGINSLASEIMAEQGMGDDADLGEMVKGFTGIDLRDGLFGAFGDTFGLYSSDTTGGGGLTSMVMFASIDDIDAMTDTKEQIEMLLNNMAAGETSGYVSLRTWMDGDVEYTTLMFPGMPIPLEITYAMSDQWAVFGATPQAALGAMRHIASGGNSLSSHAGIAALLGQSRRTAISFMDTAYYARMGYGPTSMMMSAVSNGVRSPLDATRNAGVMMPTYSEFAEGILPQIGYTEVRGQDLVTMASGDGSTVVGIAAAMGLLQEYAPLFMMPLMAAGAEDIGREFGF